MIKKIKSTPAFIALILFVICGMIAFPFIGIWCINTLFGVVIAYTWKNWVAFFLLVWVLNISLTIKSK